MKHWILAAATLLLIQGVDARERRGPPPICPQPKVDCCPKPECPPPCPPQECAPKPCKPICPRSEPSQPTCPTLESCKPLCPRSEPCEPVCCPQPCEPCCPPVCFERGFPTNPCCTPSAYSEPAAIELRCGWDVFITANFIYWEAIQGGMDLALPGAGTLSATSVLSSLTQPAVGQNILQQGFDYQPGFQVGLGWVGAKDHWVLYAEYTWLHGNTNTSANAPAPGVATVAGIAIPQNGIWIPTNWFPNLYTNNATTHISSTWDYKIDLVDAQISRPFYSGTRFLVEPFFGLRGAWIRQSMNLTATNIPSGGISVPRPTRQAAYTSTSSAVGPRIGMNGNWHFGYGIRFIGNAAASLLFSGYDVHQNVDSPDSTGGLNLFPLSTKMENLHALRPNLDLSLGLGWGSYFRCRRFHLDLAATYDFSVFWEQNMMRYLADLSSEQTGASAADLYLQGLTVTTQFDF